jgi:outer membrane protein assembly factor BamB
MQHSSATPSNDPAAPTVAYESPGPVANRPTPRVWPAVLMVSLLWLDHLLVPRFELTIIQRFFSTFLLQNAIVLAFMLWWLISRRTTWTERLVGMFAAIAINLLTASLAPKSTRGMVWVMAVLPIVLTAWTVWWVFARRQRPALRTGGVVAVVALTCAPFIFLRMDGLDGNLNQVLHWRWSPTPEQRLLAERRGGNSTRFTTLRATAPGSTILAAPGDWPGFRGPNRDGVVASAPRIAEDWSAHPPRALWRQPVGPAWSSPIIVGSRVYTQEQEGARELTVCRELLTGADVWSHADEARFDESMSGAGPRATPTYAAGRLFTLGGTGVLNCLDAANGALLWSRNLTKDHEATAPMWGFSSSPLVMGDVVIVYAGPPHGLVAYRLDSGEPAWSAPAGTQSYVSAQPARLAGVDQALFLSDAGLVSVDPATGHQLWDHAIPAPGMWRAIQPHPISDSQVLVGSETDIGTALIDVSQSDGAWTAQRKWASKGMKPSYDDFVVHKGYAYGFDGAVFCCIDLQSGKRKWRDGRYGHGQVVLLADQSLLLASTEEGGLALLRASPDAFTEVTKLDRAVAGKSWNHPAVAYGKLVLRSDQEMACFDLSP